MAELERLRGLSAKGDVNVRAVQEVMRGERRVRVWKIMLLESIWVGITVIARFAHRFLCDFYLLILLR